MTSYPDDPIYRAFYAQRYAAAQRGIKWCFDFEVVALHVARAHPSIGCCVHPRCEFETAVGRRRPDGEGDRA